MKQQQQQRGKVLVTRHYGDLAGSEEKKLDIQTFEAPHASVSAKYGLTLSLEKAYEMARVDVMVTLPCYVEEIPEAFEKAWEICRGEIQEQVAGIREKDSRRGR